MADRQILELNDGTRLTVKRESAKNPKESVQVLPTRRIPLETPKVEDGNTVEGGLQGGTDNSGF